MPDVKIHENVHNSTAFTRQSSSQQRHGELDAHRFLHRDAKYMERPWQQSYPNERGSTAWRSRKKIAELGGRQVDPTAGREPCGADNFGPLEAHSGIQMGRCEEFDLTESYVWMHAKHLSSSDSDNFAMENTSTVQTENQALENTDDAAVWPTTDDQAIKTTTTHEAGSDALQQLTQKEMEKTSELSELPPCDTHSSASSLSLSRSSRGTLINSSTYVDEHISRVIVSEETKASKDQVDMGTLGPVARL